jgi:hypothetical protein
LIAAAARNALQPFVPLGYHNPLRVPQHRLQSQEISMNKFVQLTDATTGHDIFVNVPHIIAVTPTSADRTQTWIHTANLQNPTYTIDENVDAVMQKLGG